MPRLLSAPCRLSSAGWAVPSALPGTLSAEAEKIRPFASDADRQAYFDAALGSAQSLMDAAPDRVSARARGYKGPDRIRPARQFLRRADDHLGLHPADRHLEHLCLRTPEGHPAPPADHPHRQGHLTCWGPFLAMCSGPWCR